MYKYISVNLTQTILNSEFKEWNMSDEIVILHISGLNKYNLIHAYI